MPGPRPGQVKHADDPAFRRFFGQMVQAPREGSHAEKPPPAPAPTQQVVVNRFIIEPLPPNIQRAIALRKRTIATKPSGGNKSTSYHEEKGYMENEGSSEGAKFAKVLFVVVLSLVSSILPMMFAMSAYKDMLAIESNQHSKPQDGRPSDGRPSNVPPEQRAPSFPAVRSYPCTPGSLGDRSSEGYDAPYRATGGFEVYAGCAWVIVPFATYNIQMERNVRLEHPESGQVCSDATSCVQFLNRVWQQAGDKRVRVFVPRGGEFMHWGQKS